MSSDEDERIPCKYGESCYQKNPAHHEKYKHPTKRNRTLQENDNKSPKKFKMSPETASAFNTSFDEETPDTHESEETKEREVTNEPEETNEHQQSIVLKTIDDRKKFIKQKFLVQMPDDFYQFWEFCESISNANPKNALNKIGLTLVGPYDILDKSFEPGTESDEKYLIHWRYYYDPPEFQTVIKGDDTTGYHLGYFRDKPDDKPVFVASNEAKKNCLIEPISNNLFGAVNSYLEKLIKGADPFKKISLINFQKQLISSANKLKLNIEKGTGISKYNRKPVCTSFHTAGIVVPYDPKTQLGYRKLIVNETGLKNILARVIKSYTEHGDKAFTALQPVLTAANIANDECDFGTGLEMGINLFSYGNDLFNNTALNILKVSYSLLHRRTFAKIAEAHLKNRQKEPYVLKGSIH